MPSNTTTGSGTPAGAAPFHEAREGGGVPLRELSDGQRTQLWIANVETGRSELLLAERDRSDGARHHLRGVQGLAALDRLVELVEYNSFVPGLVRAFTVLLGEAVSEGHPAREWFEQRYPKRRDNIAAALRAGIGTGEIRADVDCDAIAAEIIAMMDGLQVQWLLNPDQVDLATVFRHYMNGVCDAISSGRTD
jgi:transcriptional regulator BetI-like protein